MVFSLYLFPCPFFPLHTNILRLGQGYDNDYKRLFGVYERIDFREPYKWIEEVDESMIVPSAFKEKAGKYFPVL